MPDYFSHGVAAEIIYEKLNSEYKSRITSKTLYMLGAQGGDVFFAYNAKPTNANLGRIIHKKNAAELFERLVLGNPCYAAGFATHYALDCTLHPSIYAYESTRRSPLAHTSFESDLGLFISRKYAVRRQIIPQEKLLECTGPVYDSIKRVEPYITLTGVERCLKRYFAYTKFLFKTKRRQYKCDYDFTILAPEVEDGIELGIAAVKCILNGEVDAALFSKQFLQKKF